MTDLEKFIEVLKAFGFTQSPGPYLESKYSFMIDNTIPKGLQANQHLEIGNGEGYSDFRVDCYFDSEGKAVSGAFGVWE